MKPYLLILCICILAATSCSKNDSSLPAANHTPTEAEKHIGDYEGVHEIFAETRLDHSFAGTVHVSLALSDVFRISGLYMTHGTSEYPAGDQLVNTSILTDTTWGSGPCYFKLTTDSIFYHSYAYDPGGGQYIASFRGKRK